MDDGDYSARSHEGAGQSGDWRKMGLAALGVAFGDIGTSPLYTLREAFGHAGGLHLDAAGVLGVLSLVFWSMVLIVAVKYVVLILRADNRGEGGVLALGSLAARAAPNNRLLQVLIVGLTIAGLTLFYGDGLITPAISVLSAVEGLRAAAPMLNSYVVPLAAIVLIALFLIQSRGTGAVGNLFGPVMLIWFITLALLGSLQIVKDPAILRALDPRYALDLFVVDGWQAFVALGAIVLAVTGAEALYADMGHFGKGPIRIAWFGLVLPSLVLNYFGQGSLVLAHPQSLDHPFFYLAPDWALFPLIGLATLATIIASQAVISGVFSLTSQAIQLGHLPRMTVKHTSAEEAGQIYIARVNWILMTGVLLLVVSFASSSALASAYGISVTGAMTIDAVLAALVAAWRWKWGLWALWVFGGFLILDVAYLTSNMLKIPSGGWLPLLVAGALAFVIVTWRRGRRALRDALYGHALSIQTFIGRMDRRLIRVPGTAVFMTANPEVVPMALLHNIKHNQVLHERVVLMTIRIHDVPYIQPSQQIQLEDLGKEFYRLIVDYGFMDTPNVPRVLDLCRLKHLHFDLMRTSFFISRETLIPTPSPTLGPLESRLFIALSAANQSATVYFQIPPGRVVELGTQIEI